MKKNITTKERLFENMIKLNPDFQIKGLLNENDYLTLPNNKTHVSLSDYNNENDYEKKINEIKESLDVILNDKEYSVIDTLYNLLVRRSGKTIEETIKQIIKKT